MVLGNVSAPTTRSLQSSTFENPPGQFAQGVAEVNLALGDPGIRSGPLGRLEALLKEAIESFPRPFS